MSNISDINYKVEEFLRRALNAKDVKIIKVAKKENSWETEAEVYEESSFIKALGLPSRVMDRNLYLVILDQNLEVESYMQIEKKEQEV